MSKGIYPIGQLVRIKAIFADEDGAAIDPSAITLTIEVNDSTGDVVKMIGDLTNDSTGEFHYDYDAASTGLVEYRFVSTTPQTAGQDYFVVQASRITTP